MQSNSFLKPTSRRAMLRDSATLAGSAFLAQLFPASLLRTSPPWSAQQQSAPPAEALPQQSFATTRKLQANGETLQLEHFAPAHTDTDLFVHFQKANVIHMGDTFFNVIYPYIDGGTGGNVSGMIAAADKVLPLANDSTKIVPGQGPLGGKADLVKFRDMLVTVRDRVQKLKSAGKSAQEAVAAKPLADLEDTWGKGFFDGDVLCKSSTPRFEGNPATYILS